MEEVKKIPVCCQAMAEEPKDENYGWFFSDDGKLSMVYEGVIVLSEVVFCPFCGSKLA